MGGGGKDVRKVDTNVQAEHSGNSKADFDS